MKTTFFLCSLLSFFLLFSFAGDEHSLIGDWISDGPPNTKVTVRFTKDSTFVVKVDDKIENEGRYWVNKDTCTILDKNCGMTMAGKYRLIFYTPDSLKFSVIEDGCADRKGEIDGGVIHRAMK